MTAEQAVRSDALYRTRHQSLLSVDDLVEAGVAEVEAAGAGDRTYFLFSSDHGYRFGQFRMPQGKWNVYDNDIRIPFVLRGRGGAAGTTFDHIASQVDTMPTILGLAGVPTPPTMDGRNFVLSTASSTPLRCQHCFEARAGQRQCVERVIQSAITRATGLLRVQF